MYECHYIVMDFETGGFSAEKNPITEVGLVALNHKFEKVQEWGSFVRPYNNLAVEKGALQATNLTLEEIMTGIDQKEAYQKISSIFKELKCSKFNKPHLAGHNFYRFDMPFLRYLFKLNNDDVDKYIDYVWDTMRMAQYMWSTDSIPNYQLGTCCKRAGIELVEAHRALPDTVATSQLFSFFKSTPSSTAEVVTEKRRFRDEFRF